MSDGSVVELAVSLSFLLACFAFLELTALDRPHRERPVAIGVGDEACGNPNHVGQ